MTIKYNFFGRNGGVSTDPKYRSLNCHEKSNDDHENVKKNQEIVKKFFDGKDELKLFFVDQVHSDKIFIVNTENDLEKYEEADGIVTNLKNIILGISTADCTPILFYDEKQEVIGACHAGWKGACSDLTKNLIDIMVQKYSCNINSIKIKIGPTIRQNSYQTQKDFYDKWIEKSSNFEKFFDKKSDGYYFDLPGAIIYKLTTLGILPENIDDCRIDTYQNENYFSYRTMIKEGLIKSGEKYFGANTSGIVIL